ncbi:eCIS core domain-containing protein [Pseudanabaena minima]|uniref:eCIS core domain-containing protein n=1 Tax=Pseudanabaena minima TaxID=890415 RepID=UPI003DAA04A9
MGHTNDRSTKASSLVNPTSLNLQPRLFAPLKSDEKEESVARKSGYSENFLEKIINTPSLESATPVQRKSGNRLKAIAAERANAALQNQSIQRQEAVEEEKSEGEQEDTKEFTMNPEPPPVQRKFENRLRAKNAQRMEIQAKLAIGEPNDKYEQEADATAARVVQQINSPMTSQDQPVQRKFENQLRAKNAQKMAIQAKLAIGEPNDKYEQEADANAARVVQQINSSTSASTTSQSQPVQRQGTEEDEEVQMKPIVQRRENIGGGEASTDLESAIQSARGSGQSLDANLQRSMGQAMGADFSGVKVHTDSQSDQLNKSIQAKAFTTGQDVFFRQGAYEPGSRGGQELIAHELTHVVQQNGGKTAGTAQLTLQRKPLDADTILKGVPAIISGNSLLPDNGELKLDTVLFSDKTLKGRIEDIISTYEAQFQKDESKMAVSHNAQKVLAAFQTIGMVIARKLHMGQEGHKIAKALLASQKDRLISELKTNTSESKESNALSQQDAEDALKMAEVLAGDDPVGMYAQDKTSLKKADASIRLMASGLKKTPSEVFELLRHQFESKIGSLSLKDVKAGEMKAPEGYTFPLKDLYGEVSENFFKNLLDLDEGGKVKWKDTGLKANTAPGTWKDQARSFKTNDINSLRDSVSKAIDPKDAFSITKEEQGKKGWERLNNSQMEYLSDVEEKEGGEEAGAKQRIISYFTETKKLSKEEAIKTMNKGLSNLNDWPITLTTKSQDMLKSSGEVVDSYKPFFSVFEQEKRVKNYLPNLETDSTVKIVEDVLGRGLDYGQERKEKDEQQVGFDSPLSLTDLPAMSCINHAYQLNKGPNYYGDTHFVLNPTVRNRSVFAYGTACPERRSFILVLDDILSKEPKSVELICEGNYKAQDIEVHVYGNIELKKDITEFHLGNPNVLEDADTRSAKQGLGSKILPGNSPTEKLVAIKSLFPKEFEALKKIWINKQKGHEKLKELVRSLDPSLVDSNIDDKDAVTQTIDEETLKKDVVPTSKEEVGKNKGTTTKKKIGCYITTACINARGLSDDCEELQTLRQFRDQYMLNLPSGQDLVEFYYEQSPRIVNAIDKSERSEAIYEDLYQVIRGCVDVIHQANYHKALTTYIAMVLQLRDEFTPELAVPHSLLDATRSESENNEISSP